MSVFGDVDQVCSKIDPDYNPLCVVDNTPYKFVPSLWLGITFTAVYGMLMAGHLALGLWNRKRGGFMLLAALCAAGEAAGWASRLYSSQNPFSSDAYISQIVCLILSPVFISAANYVVLEQLARSVGHDFMRLRPRTYFCVFVSGDILSLIIQAVGGALSATAADDDALRVGSDITLVGVAVQVAVTAPFELLFIDFHLRHWRQYRKERRMVLAAQEHVELQGKDRKQQPDHINQDLIIPAAPTVSGPTSTVVSPRDSLHCASRAPFDAPPAYAGRSASAPLRSYGRWPRGLVALSAASTVSTVLILVRCIYRLLEMAQGWDGELAREEGMFAIFDGTAIALAVAVFLIAHPSFLIPERRPAEDGDDAEKQRACSPSPEDDDDAVCA